MPTQRQLETLKSLYNSELDDQFRIREDLQELDKIINISPSFNYKKAKMAQIEKNHKAELLKLSCARARCYEEIMAAVSEFLKTKLDD